MLMLPVSTNIAPKKAFKWLGLLGVKWWRVKVMRKQLNTPSRAKFWTELCFLRWGTSNGCSKQFIQVLTVLVSGPFWWPVVTLHCLFPLHEASKYQVSLLDPRTLSEWLYFVSPLMWEKALRKPAVENEWLGTKGKEALVKNRSTLVRAPNRRVICV